MHDDKLMILVVDDNDEDRTYLLRALKQSGLSFQAVETFDMEEALTACQTETFDCAFVDYHLPGQDGLEGICNFQQQFPDMATIMVTGQGDEVIASQVMKQGAGDYIPKKHVNASALKHIIEHVLEKTVFQKKLARQREELENFALVLAHDLQSPTQNIRNLIGLIQEKMSHQELEEDVVEYMAGVCKCANVMETLVDALAMYTKFDAVIEFDDVSLEECVAMAVSLLEFNITQKRAKVIFQDLPMIYGHEPQIIQLFQNLIANALKYNESEIPTITITAELAEDMFQIAIEDNGIGIPEKYSLKIFEPFTRLHGKDSPYAGSGLGLTTCKKIVQRHGGTISCESTKKQGARFIVTLPSYSAAVVTM